MGNEIQIGMKFGSYSNKIKDLSSQYVKHNRDVANDKFMESACVFTEPEGRVRANAYREKIFQNEYGQAMYSDAVIFADGLRYGTSAKTEEGLDKFDYIAGKKQYAIDLNANGIVDNGEIFDGSFDRYSYQKAKDDGDLNKYQQYVDYFTY